jgi:hypothetical protein
VVQLHREQPALEATGAKLHVIGSGAPMFIEGFRETTSYDGPLYTDPSLAVYEAAQLQRGVGSLFRPDMLARSVAKGFGALRRGARQGVTRGDTLQQGGVLVVDREGRILYRHVSTFAGDNAAPAAIAAALR